MADTTIEWATKVWNVTRGCARVSPGCGTGREGGCYAERQAHRFSGPGGAYEGLTELGKHGPRWTGECRFIPEKLTDPLRWNKPERIFVNSMSDLFHKDISNEYIAAVFGVMAACPHLTFQVLTKRAERLPEWFAWLPSHYNGPRRIPEWATPELQERLAEAPEAPWPLPNVHLGVSAEDQQRADERIPYLLRTPAAVRWVSAEPLLGDIILREEWTRGRFIECPDENRGDEIDPCVGCDAIPNDGQNGGDYCGAIRGPKLDWVVVGGESGPGARPMYLEWARSIIAQCKAAGVPVFYKQGGASIPCEHSRKGGCLECAPADLRVREFPR